MVDELPIYVSVALLICLIMSVALIWVIANRTRKTNEQTESAGIKVHGASATTKFEWNKDVEALVSRLNTLVKTHRRYKTMTTTPSGVEIQVKGSFWSWGEVIYLSFQKDAPPFQVTAECRPSVKTTIYDHGQCGKDLTEFVKLMS
jgi:hypothetical protein